MTGKTKTTLAIIFGVVGILLGILGTITAFNAKNAVDDDKSQTSEVAALVEQKFNEAQAKQDQAEANQRSEAEKLVAQLTQGKMNLLQKINTNHRQLKKVRRQVKNLSGQVSSLQSRDRELQNEIDQIENDQQADYNQLNGRINNLNRNVQQLQKPFARLNGEING